MARMRNGGWNRMSVALLLVALGVTAPAAGQPVVEPRVWAAVSVQGRMGADSPWRWTSDSLVRTRDGARELDFLEERVTVIRDLTRRSSAGIGYAYGVGFPEGGSMREHRFVQQYSWSGGARRRVSLRSSLEERVVTGHDALLLRVRQQVRVTWPLAAQGRLLGVASDEVSVQINSTARSSRGLEGNRMFVGVARRLTAHSGVEIGYTHVHSRGASGRHRRSHGMSAALVLSR